MSSLRQSALRIWLIIVIFVVPPVLSYAQNTGVCAWDGATNSCVVRGGTLCAVGNGGGTCSLGENGCWCFLPNYTLAVSPFTPSPVDAGTQATATVTVSLAAGATGFPGNIQLSCPSGALQCVFSPNPLLSKGAPVNSTLTVTPPACNSNYTITVTGQDASSGNSGPANGPQSATLATSPCVVNVGDLGGGSIALLTFLVLLTLWMVWIVRRQRAASR